MESAIASILACTTAGCYGMWVLTDQDNVAAMRAYQAGGGTDPQQHTLISWTFEQELG